MLVFDMRSVGEKLWAIRKRAGLSQAEVAERANLSDRTYADIERGAINARMETILRICRALYITPDALFTEETPLQTQREDLLRRLDTCPPHAQETALRLLSVYLDSL
ncbi:MAG: helix-turn-helix transcriptional regulator [Oscillospiraceae bacterium]|nr:helix-turn-helix transcriptional regulator [Oscillospiraceae bacterium]